MLYRTYAPDSLVNVAKSGWKQASTKTIERIKAAGGKPPTDRAIALNRATFGKDPRAARSAAARLDGYYMPGNAPKGLRGSNVGGRTKAEWKRSGAVPDKKNRLAGPDTRWKPEQYK